MAKEKEAPKKLSRREFVKGAAAGAAAVAGAGALASCAPAATPAPAPTCPPAAECPPAEECAPCATPWIPEKWDYEADVVVCGSGAMGSSAAIEAHDAGAEVLIIESCDWLGGSMRRCGGVVVGANTSVQRALGVEDSADELYKYVIACGEGFVDPALVRVYADNSGKNIDWMIEDLGGVVPAEMRENFGIVLPGLNYDSDDKSKGDAPYSWELYGLPAIPRLHWFTPAREYQGSNDPGKGWEGGLPGGTGLFKLFDDAIKAREIREMLETVLIELVATPDREVLGIKALSAGKTLSIKAKSGVVLATGTWTSNAKLVSDYLPSTAGQDPSVFAALPCNAGGEGIVAAQAIGADLAMMGFPFLFPAGGVRINPQAQVIDVFGDPIPRLYAGGDTAGGVFAGKYPTSGTCISQGVCFGRIGGQNAAAETAWV